MKPKMKKVLTMLFLLFASAAFASDANQPIVRWDTIIGVITAQGVDNPVSKNIHSAPFAWSAQSGHASVNLTTGDASFEVKGFVLNGTTFSGTPGPVTAVTGTLVCNSGSDTETALDSKPARLNSRGDAQFSGQIANIPSSCSNPLFLLRIANLKGLNGLWIATGAVRTTSTE